MLDHLVALNLPRTTYLAPGNDFGCGVSEQEAAERYLAGRLALIAVPTDSRSYVDTRGKARSLRWHFEGRRARPSSPIVMVVAFRHARRAELCFRKEGFEIAAVVAEPYRVIPGAAIMQRLCYYRRPALHRIYEVLAWARDRARRRMKR